MPKLHPAAVLMDQPLTMDLVTLDPARMYMDLQLIMGFQLGTNLQARTFSDLLRTMAFQLVMNLLVRTPSELLRIMDSLMVTPLQEIYLDQLLIMDFLTVTLHQMLIPLERLLITDFQLATLHSTEMFLEHSSNMAQEVDQLVLELLAQGNNMEFPQLMLQKERKNIKPRKTSEKT